MFILPHKALYIFLFIILFYILVLPWSYITRCKPGWWKILWKPENFVPFLARIWFLHCIWYLSSSVFLAGIWFLHCMWYLPYSMFLARIWFLQSSLHVISFIFSIFAQGMITPLPIIVSVISRIFWIIICNIPNIYCNL